jgi:hypothetical protein
MGVQTQPEWLIPFNEYLKRIVKSPQGFREMLQLPKIQGIQQVLPLRDLKQIQAVLPLPRALVLYIVQNIKTLDGQRPFKNASLEIRTLDPGDLKIGQRFVYRENYTALLEGFSDIFKSFMLPGLTGLGSMLVFGYDASRTYSLAFYLPPIIEAHGPDLVVMDGIHRNYIAKQTGSGMTALVVRGADAAFPCSSRDWSEIQVISLKEKPKDITERYFDLQKGLFRDLKYLGIDG